MPLGVSRGQRRSWGYRSGMHGKGYRPQSLRRQALGTIGLGRGRSEGRALAAFNAFPAIATAFPDILGDIVIETTRAIASKAAASAPARSGRLRESGVTIFRRRGGHVTTGRIEFKAIDPTKSDPRHLYAFYVEVGTVNTPSEPFLLPAVIEERAEFVTRLLRIESRLAGR